MKDSLDSYKKLFISEVSSYIEKLNNYAISLEKKSHSPQIIEELFRIFHTIKGMAASMGYKKMVDTAHSLENILYKIKEGKIIPERDIVNKILQGVDIIEKEIALISKNESVKSTQEIKFRLKNTTPMPNARGMVILNLISKKTKLNSSSPSIADLKSKTDDYFEYSIIVEDVNLAKEILSNISDVEILSDVTPKEEETLTSKKLKEIRVEVEELDKLQNIMSESIISKERIYNLAVEYRNEALQDAIENHSKNITQLKDVIMKIRMVPLSTLFDRLPRYVRDLAENLKKQVHFEIIGGDIELDRSLIESISDPMIHILRNSIDHGIESPEERKKQGKSPAGKLQLKAEREKGYIKISIIDDGRGIDTDSILDKAVKIGIIKNSEREDIPQAKAFSFLFLPGFSTREDVSKVSGRGVGLDVVKNTIRKIGGTVELSSKKGIGTTVITRIPLTMAIIKAYIVQSGKDLFAIPMTFLEETANFSGDAISYIHNKPVFILRKKVLPVYFLSKLFGEENGIKKDSYQSLIINLEGKNLVLVVDKLIGSSDIVVKPVPFILRRIKEYTGVTILGDGKPCMILDVPNLV